MNCRLLLIVVILSAANFGLFLEGELRAREKEPEIIVVKEASWFCDGWAGKKYPTERSMRKSFKGIDAW